MKKRNLLAFILFFLLLLAGYFYSQHSVIEEGTDMDLTQMLLNNANTTS